MDIVDNVVLQMNGILFLKIRDAFAASYGVEDAEFAITQVCNYLICSLSIFYQYCPEYS